MGSKGFILGFCEDRCEDSKGSDGILKKYIRILLGFL